jgi:hypothetical protein
MTDLVARENTSFVLNVIKRLPPGTRRIRLMTLKYGIQVVIVDAPDAEPIGTGARPQKKMKRAAPELPIEIMKMIMVPLIEKQMVRQINMLSMVNKSFYRVIVPDFNMWYALYQKPGTMYLPNHLYSVIRKPDWLNPANFMNRVENYERARRHYKRIATLHATHHCSQCGRNTYMFKNFYNINQHLCDNCVRDNFISNRALYDKYGLMLISRIGESNFPAMVANRVYYVTAKMSAMERSEWSNERVDHMGAKMTTLMFWKKDLEKVFNLHALAEERPQRYAAAQVIKAFAKREFIRRTMKHHVTAKDRRYYYNHMMLKASFSKPASFPDYTVKSKSVRHRRWFVNLLNHHENETPLRDAITCEETP